MLHTFLDVLRTIDLLNNFLDLCSCASHTQGQTMVSVTADTLDLGKSAEVLTVIVIQTNTHFRIHYFARVCSTLVLSTSSEAYALFQESNYDVTIIYF